MAEYFGPSEEVVEGGIFACTVPLETEMARFEALRAADEAAAANVIKHGAMLVALAKRGDLERLALMVRTTAPTYWFTVQMLLAAAESGQAKIVAYMVDNGAKLDSAPLKEILIHVAAHCDAEDGGENCADVATYLVRTAKINVDAMRKSDYWTAMHVAVARGLVKLVHHLVSLGANVNAVAENDVMPLHLAESQAPQEAQDSLVTFLCNHGARRDWRDLLRSTPKKPTLEEAVAKLRLECAAKDAARGQEAHSSRLVLETPDDDNTRQQPTRAAATEQQRSLCVGTSPQAPSK